MRLARLSLLRITALFAVLTLLPLLLLAFSSVRLSTDAIQTQVQARIRGAATNGAAYVGSEMKSLSQLVASYAQRPSFRHAIASRWQADFDPGHIASHLR